MNKQISERGNK